MKFLQPVAQSATGISVAQPGNVLETKSLDKVDSREKEKSVASARTKALKDMLNTDVEREKKVKSGADSWNGTDNVVNLNDEILNKMKSVFVKAEEEKGKLNKKRQDAMVKSVKLFANVVKWIGELNRTATEMENVIKQIVNNLLPLRGFR